MSLRTEASSHQYDVVIVGAGFGGMTAGGLLAKGGQKVLIVEKEARPGGYAGATVFGDYRFDAAARLINGCAADGPFGPGPVYRLLAALRVQDRCEFIRPDPFCGIRLPGLQLDMRQGREGFLQSFCHVFPTERRNLVRLLDTCREIGRATSGWRTSGLFPALLMALKTPQLARYANTTLEQGLRAHLSDERARAACGALWPYLGLPPRRASFLVWAAMMAFYIEDGAFCCRGSMQRLADAIAEGVVAQGAELLLNARVVKILADQRRVRGVELESGQCVSAPVVISDGEVPTVFRELLDPESVPVAYARRLGRMEQCGSAASLCLATDLDLSAWPHESVIATDWSADVVWEQSHAGQVRGFGLTVPTIGDPGLAPPGQHLVSMTITVPGVGRAAPAEAGPGRVAQSMLAELEKWIPSIGTHLAARESGASATGYWLQTFGPMYGWAISPQQSGYRRLSPTTPLGGLYLVGHWTQPGHGVISVVMSGESIAREVLTRMSSPTRTVRRRSEERDAADRVV